MRHFEASMPLVMASLQLKLTCGTYGKLSRKKVVKLVKRVFQLWNDKSVYNASLTTGWFATLKVDRESYFAYKDEVDAEAIN